MNIYQKCMEHDHAVELIIFNRNKIINKKFIEHIPRI